MVFTGVLIMGAEDENKFLVYTQPPRAGAEIKNLSTPASRLLCEMKRGVVMERSSLRDFFISELKKSHDAETQLIKALEAAAQASTSPQLRQAFESHLEQTKDHATRIQMILEALGEEPRGTKCAGMTALIGEMEQVQHEGLSADALDSALIAYAQRIEHYEIAMYGTLRDYASALGELDTASQLQNTLEEEQDAEHQMTKIGQAINAELARKETGPRGLAAEHEPAPRIKPAA